MQLWAHCHRRVRDKRRACRPNFDDARPHERTKLIHVTFVDVDV
jgi:hypothetical protein